MPSRTRPASSSGNRRHVGVVDIGSNSIRLVVFDRLSRAPLPVFNEKVLCGLGRGLERTGRLHEDGAVQALDNLSRFAALARAMGLARLAVLATAAVREAENGPEFVRAVRAEAGLTPTILSGADEARMSAAGVIAGIPDADGVMGDLGGGSLELVRLSKGRIGAHTTLPFGPLRLRELVERESKGHVRTKVDAALRDLEWLAGARGRRFYAVGGAWRSIARLHMDHVGASLRVIQHYSLPLKEAVDFMDRVATADRDLLQRMGKVSRKRIDSLPLAAMVLKRILERARPSELVFSAFGLREGFIYQQLSAAERRADPLLVACADVGSRHPRFALDGVTLARWLAPLFGKSGAAHERLRVAACHLADIAWTEHPDYRAETAFRTTLHMPLPGIDHPGRAFLALALYTRYDGPQGSEVTRPAWRLLGEEDLAAAWRLGLALRLTFTLSAGAPDLLGRMTVGIDGRKVVLRLPPALRSLAGEAAQRRLAALADALDRKAVIQVGRQARRV